MYGSSGLLKVAHEAGWIPGGWDGPQFGARIVNQQLGAHSLNFDATITSWSEVALVARMKGWSRVFVRPESETKEFPGTLYDVGDLELWVNSLREAEYLNENDSEALVGPVQTIGREWRIFVVDGEPVSICQYAPNGYPKLASDGPSELTEYVSSVLRMHKPAPCFVLDVAEVLLDEQLEYRVVEFNSINSSGFYLCDIDKVVGRLSEYVA